MGDALFSPPPSQQPPQRNTFVGTSYSPPLAPWAKQKQDQNNQQDEDAQQAQASQAQAQADNKSAAVANGTAPEKKDKPPPPKLSFAAAAAAGAGIPKSVDTATNGGEWRRRRLHLVSLRRVEHRPPPFPPKWRMMPTKLAYLRPCLSPPLPPPPRPTPRATNPRRAPRNWRPTPRGSTSRRGSAAGPTAVVLALGQHLPHRQLLPPSPTARPSNCSSSSSSSSGGGSSSRSSSKCFLSQQMSR